MGDCRTGSGASGPGAPLALKCFHWRRCDMTGKTLLRRKVGPTAPLSPIPVMRLTLEAAWGKHPTLREWCIFSMPLSPTIMISPLSCRDASTCRHPCCMMRSRLCTATGRDTRQYSIGPCSHLFPPCSIRICGHRATCAAMISAAFAHHRPRREADNPQHYPESHNN